MTARMISGDIFEAFLRCDTKGYLKSLGQTGDASAISSWAREVREDYRRSCHSGCDFISSAALDSPKPSFLEHLKNGKHHILLDCRIETFNALPNSSVGYQENSLSSGNTSGSAAHSKQTLRGV
jgi:hypothetical protein